MQKRFLSFIGLPLLLAVLSFHQSVLARSAPPAAEQIETGRYIVILDDPPLVAYDGRLIRTPERAFESVRLPATANSFTGAPKLDVSSPVSQQYLKFLDERFEHFLAEAALELGRRLKPEHRYKYAVNGFSTRLTVAELKILRNMLHVKVIRRDEIQRLETDSGPNWIGAGSIQGGTAGHPATGGQGVVAAIIDTGINWEHLSFQDQGQGGGPGWDHVNPYGVQLGLCTDLDVECNDKLVGVYDFVTEDPFTPWPEENTKGRDNDGHGSHTGSTMAGNPVDVPDLGVPLQVAGVAPNANIISYRVCYIGDPFDPEDDGCQDSAILAAINQAIADQVDVINYSIGGSASDPWETGSSSMLYLMARDAGIFVATSAGNTGPGASSMGSPANAPWITAVGSATHDRVFGSTIENLTGGDTAPPDDIVGASFTAGIGDRAVVHARDFGNALCGIGDSESQPECSGNTGASNPFPPGTFSGEIVICDRGDFGRVEKGKNLMLAGAGGYILANTDTSFKNVVADDHCLPATHINTEDGDNLRSWQASGTGHRGSMSGYGVFHTAKTADRVSDFSARGPNLSPVQDVMKPDLIAPGEDILAAVSIGIDSFDFLNGTSMSSPHVAGAAALLKAVHPDWTPGMLLSALAMTATPELAVDFDDSEVGPHERGAGRPRLDQAVNMALYLEETTANFLAAESGNPKQLNLPGLVDSSIFTSYDFERTVTDLAGGASWTASSDGFPPGVVVTVTPAAFTLADGASQSLDINVNLSGSMGVGSWTSGSIRLSSAGLPDAVFPVAVSEELGELPSVWEISTDQISGWKEFALGGLAAMPDATFTTGGLVVPTDTVDFLSQDPTPDSPYDSPFGTMTVWHTVTDDTLWLHTRTLVSTSDDLDLFVGRDTNGNGIAEEGEELCASFTPDDLELCDLFEPQAGSYWVIVQNWSAGPAAPDEVTLRSAVVNKDTISPLAATGNGIAEAGEVQAVRLSWDNVGAAPGTQLLGAVGVGTRRETANNFGIIPVRFNRTGTGSVETLVLMDGVTRGLTVKGGTKHFLTFVDIPPGADSLTVSASGADALQNDKLEIELHRIDFNSAFTKAPFARNPNAVGDPIASGSGDGGEGPSVTVSGETLVPGRWYAIIKNQRTFPSSVEVTANIEYAGVPVEFQKGLWQSSSRPGIRQGFDYNSTGPDRALLWYTFGQDGNSEWYLAADSEPIGNVWVAQLLRFTNDGAKQQATPVGYVSVTILGEDDAIFSFVLFGQEGSERMLPSAVPGCPTIESTEQSYTGIFSTSPSGLGGASVLVNADNQGHVHYVYDAQGRARWMQGSAGSTTQREIPVKQFTGDCAVCTQMPVTKDTIGLLTRDFTAEGSVTWILDYVFNAPLSGSVNRTDDASKLTLPLFCN